MDRQEQRPGTEIDNNPLTRAIIDALRLIYDPEIPVNIYDLGLIYRIAVNEYGSAHVQMTLTAPACPVAETFPGIVETAIRSIPGVRDVDVELVWDPPWSEERMSDEAKREIGIL
uniref:FeS assembly SUF system protein n=1 Tax=Candidatus Kentrum sp. DK TaxID=2126562 RepID=A0A450SG25_9GAMM|nr:MAG: FeS assembly SUF system protein [Candidatus Kentron sp. DK]VFJ53927.1 MAG: FeS assembly SUF system protein [Candidatus Kentron sp. DK]